MDERVKVAFQAVQSIYRGQGAQQRQFHRELTALVCVLIEKGLMTLEEFEAATKHVEAAEQVNDIFPDDDTHPSG